MVDNNIGTGLANTNWFDATVNSKLDKADKIVKSPVSLNSVMSSTGIGGISIGGVGGGGR